MAKSLSLAFFPADLAANVAGVNVAYDFEAILNESAEAEVSKSNQFPFQGEPISRPLCGSRGPV
jgi:hypothetical protein